VVKQRLAAGEGGVEDIDLEAGAAEMRAQIQDAQRRVGLHDLHLLGILVEEVTVSEQEVRHQAV